MKHEEQQLRLGRWGISKRGTSDFPLLVGCGLKTHDFHLQTKFGKSVFGRKAAFLASATQTKFEHLPLASALQTQLETPSRSLDRILNHC
ncbi:hypothetical protein DB48_09800 [Shewanella sp. cp20]|nr:hypothetical protein DB48_09800 [Shewanella sp. cp20]